MASLEFGFEQILSSMAVVQQPQFKQAAPLVN
jgi:hypothetical protein